MTDAKYDALIAEKRCLNQDDFLSVLNHYGIQVKGKSILCPFHKDEHYGSCFLNRKGAYCHVCNRQISAVDIVMEKEGLPFMEALEFLLTQVLGRPVAYEQCQKQPLLTYKEFLAIGLSGAFPKMSECFCNLGVNGAELKKGLFWGPAFESKYLAPIYHQKRYDSLQELYETEPSAALEIIRGKIRETNDMLYGKLREIDRGKSRLGLLCKQDPKYKKEMKTILWDQINAVKMISNKLSRRQIQKSSA